MCMPCGHFTLDQDHAPCIKDFQVSSDILHLKKPSAPLVSLRGLTVFDDLDGLIMWTDFCPQIETLILTVLPHRGGDAQIPRVVQELPCLTYLELIYELDVDEPIQMLIKILDNIHTPNLGQLKLSHYDEGSNSLQRELSLSLLDFLRRSRPPLKDVTLGCMSVSADDLPKILENMPLLESLCLSETMVVDSVLEALTAVSSTEEGSMMLCPRLRRLTMNVEDISEAPLVNMILSRWRGTSSSKDEDGGREIQGQLVELDIYWFSGIEFPISEHPAVANCIAQGLKINVRLPGISFVDTI